MNVELMLQSAMGLSGVGNGKRHGDDFTWIFLEMHGLAVFYPLTFNLGECFWRVISCYDK